MYKGELQSVHGHPDRSIAKGRLLQLAGAICIGVAITLFLISSGVGVNLPWALHLSISALSVLVGIGGMFLWLRGQRFAAPSGVDVLQDDGRPPVTYLRSFHKDQEFVLGATSWLGIPTPTDEQLLAKLLEQVGPVVAIGKPGEDLPKLGAARFYVGDEGWKDEILKLLERSKLVVLRAGDTDGFWWEFQRTLKQVAPQRLLVFLGPPVAEAHTGAARDEYLRFAVKANESLPVSLPLDIDPPQLISFGENWEPILLRVRLPSASKTLKANYSAALAPYLKQYGLREEKAFSIKRVLVLLVICVTAIAGIALALMLL